MIIKDGLGGQTKQNVLVTGLGEMAYLMLASLIVGVE